MSASRWICSRPGVRLSEVVRLQSVQVYCDSTFIKKSNWEGDRESRREMEREGEIVREREREGE